MLHGNSYLVPTPDEAASYPYTADEQHVLDRWTDSVLQGTPDQVAEFLRSTRSSPALTTTPAPASAR
ncbi:hypothetical protein [Streptomyces luteogriseus]|uniref:hypothetical protein n=1 Tax=Streptomyces luteogriseus TaxID=68233 RepID=UPI0037FC5694